MTYEISRELVEALLRYMVTRPYAEVADGIAALQSLKPIEGEKTSTK